MVVQVVDATLALWPWTVYFDRFRVGCLVQGVLKGEVIYGIVHGYYLGDRVLDLHSVGSFREKPLAVELRHSDGRRVRLLDLVQRSRRFCQRHQVSRELLEEVYRRLKKQENDADRSLFRKRRW